MTRWDTAAHAGWTLATWYALTAGTGTTAWTLVAGVAAALAYHLAHHGILDAIGAPPLPAL